MAHPQEKELFPGPQKVAGFLFAMICNYGNRWCKEGGLTKSGIKTLLNWGR